MAAEEKIDFWEEVDKELTSRFGPKWHCDQWIDDPSVPECARVFLDRARGPAHGHLTPDGKDDLRPYPRLFANHPELGRVRVTMASRFGHVGVTPDLTIDRGYERTAYMAELSDFSADP